MKNTSPVSFKPFLLLWAGQALSVFGSALSYAVVSMWLASVHFPSSADKPALATALMLLSLAYALPGILAAPFAGLIADRHPRGTIMRMADLSSGLLSAVIVFLAFSGLLNLPLLYGLIALVAISATFHSLALGASYILLVPEKHLARANTMMQSLWLVTGLIAPGIAVLILLWPSHMGWHLPAAGLGLAFLIDAASFLIAALTLFLVKIPATPPAEHAPEPGLLNEALVGWRFIQHRPALLVTLISFAAMNLAAAPMMALEPLLAQEQLLPNLTQHQMTLPAGLALIATMNAGGGLLGAGLMLVWGGVKRSPALLIFGLCLLGGAAQVVYGMSQDVYLTGSMIGLFIFTTPIVGAHTGALWQKAVPAEVQGRVFAVQRLLSQGISPLSIAFFGLLAGHLPVGPILAYLGIVACIASVLPLLRQDVRGLGNE